MSTFFSTYKHDIFIFILSLLPPAEFFQCKRVCKEWNGMIEKHREENEISIDCIERAFHFLSWRDVLHYERNMKKMIKNNLPEYKIFTKKKICIGNQYATVSLDKTCFFHPISGDRIPCVSTFKISRIIPIGNAFITTHKDKKESKMLVYYTILDEKYSIVKSWLLPIIESLTIIGVAKKGNLVAFCTEGYGIKEFGMYVRWFYEKNLDISKDEIQYKFAKIDLPRQMDVVFHSNFFGLIRKDFYFVKHNSIIRLELFENGLCNQEKVLDKLSTYTDRDELGMRNYLVFCDKRNIFAVSCYRGTKLSISSPFYPNNATLDLNRNVHLDNYRHFDYLCRCFIVNDIFFAQLNSGEMYCFDFNQVKKFMESKQEHSLEIKGKTLDFSWITWNHSFALMKRCELLSIEKMDTPEPLFYLLKLNSLTYSTIEKEKPTAMELLDFNSKMKETIIKRYNFCLDGICCEFEKRTIAEIDTGKKQKDAFVLFLF